ncbi:hypothetical protein CBM2634_U210006 [Cupriavidus taiwanensis]|uniref:Uncharacterized protein n=1 Tax=Cupriavidus taiwanensis TaxID=164546 RepID=A0A375JD24_9BURK|nr:hypothetical protein CBM2634_U210006 [Cupriavidus taiwanensis]
MARCRHPLNISVVTPSRPSSAARTAIATRNTSSSKSAQPSPVFLDEPFYSPLVSEVSTGEDESCPAAVLLAAILAKTRPKVIAQYRMRLIVVGQPLRRVAPAARAGCTETAQQLKFGAFG